MARPSWYITKGERNSSPYYLDFDPLERYRNIATGIYTWHNLPEDVPEGYIERVLFDYPGVSAKDVPGLGICILPVAPVNLSIYGTPIDWKPTGLQGISLQVKELLETSDNPVLWQGEPPAETAKIYANILKNALISLQQNVIGLRQPIALDGEPGSTADAMVLAGEIDQGELFIPVIEAERIGVKVIDLLAKDHTASLVSTCNAMDNEILSILGVRNTGTEKASGVNIAESTSLHQELAVTSGKKLKDRIQWCEKINAVLGTDWWVELSEEYQTVEGYSNVQRPEGNNGSM